MSSKRRVVILAFPGVQTLDVTGPAEVFRAASLSRPPGYEVTVAATTTEPLPTSTVSFVPDARVDEITGPALPARHVRLHRRLPARQGRAARRAPRDHALGELSRSLRALPAA